MSAASFDEGCVCYGEPHGVECEYCIAVASLGLLAALVAVFEQALVAQAYGDWRAEKQREASEAPALATLRRLTELVEDDDETSPLPWDAEDQALASFDDPLTFTD